MSKQIILLAGLLYGTLVNAQVQTDTLAFQPFETIPGPFNWPFTGPVVYNSGMSGASASPANSPIGIGGSQAWETTTNSGGLTLLFNNVPIPAGYDSVRFHFNLAAFNLNGTTGGPDDLDYVEADYSLDGGVNFSQRLRIQGSTANNSTWAYNATGVAKLYYMPATQIVFQPVTSGLQTTMGYSNCEIVFPGSVTQIQVRLKARSSSSSDTWMIDNVILTGDKYCSNSFSTLSDTSCFSFTAPDGSVYNNSGTYTAVIPNASGCDSIITMQLTISQVDTGITQNSITLVSHQSGAVYQWLNCSNGFQPVTGATSAFFTPSANGIYALQVTFNGCTDTTSCYVVSGVGISEAAFLQEFQISPNPVQHLLHISWPQIQPEVQVSIHELSGRQVFTETVFNSSGIIVIPDFASGCYIVTLLSKEFTLHKSFIKQ